MTYRRVFDLSPSSQQDCPSRSPHNKRHEKQHDLRRPRRPHRTRRLLSQVPTRPVDRKRRCAESNVVRNVNQINLLTPQKGHQKRHGYNRLEFVLRASLRVPLHLVSQRRLQQTPGAVRGEQGERRRRQRNRPQAGRESGRSRPGKG